MKGKGRGVIWKWAGGIEISEKLAADLLMEIEEHKFRRVEGKKNASIEKVKKLISADLDNPADAQFDAILSGKDPFIKSNKEELNVTSVVPVAVSGPSTGEKQSVSEEKPSGPIKKKSYGITRIFWGMIPLRTNYYE